MKTFTTLRAVLAGAALLIAPAACSNDNKSEPAAEQRLPSILDDDGKGHNLTQVIPNDNVAPDPAPEPAQEPPAIHPDPEPELSFAGKLRQGKKLSARGEHLPAIAMLEKAVAQEPKSPRANIELARALVKAGDARGARPYAELAVELDPESSYGWNTLGRVELMEGKRDAAITSFSRATDENEDNYYAWNNLGLTYILEKRWSDAADALSNATAGPKPKAYMWNNLGTAYEHLDQLDEARAAYRQAASMGSELARTSVERLEGVTTIAELDDAGAEDADEDEVIAPADEL